MHLVVIGAYENSAVVNLPLSSEHLVRGRDRLGPLGRKACEIMAEAESANEMSAFFVMPCCVRTALRQSRDGKDEGLFSDAFYADLRMRLKMILDDIDLVVERLLFAKGVCPMLASDRRSAFVRYRNPR